MKDFTKCGLLFLLVITIAFSVSAQYIEKKTLNTGAVDVGLIKDIKISRNYVKTILPDSEKILRNPLSGWVLYGSSFFPDDFWKRYDNLHIQDSDKTIRIEDYAQTLYLRLSWSIFNPKENEYGWDTNERLKELIAEAKRRKMKLAFRVVVDSRDKKMNATPLFVKQAGAQGFESKSGNTEVWSPYPDDPVFQSKYEKFIKAFAARFDNPDEVEFIDGYGLGKWGEGHAVVYKNYADREKVFKWIIDLYDTYFTHVPIAINYHREIGDTISWGPPNPQSEKLLDYAANKGYILRHDAFGMTGYYQQWERNYAAKWRYKRPIIMEGGWIIHQHNIKLDPKKYQTGADVRRGEFDDAQEAHVNMMDFRYGETESWFEQYPLIRQFDSIGAYRLFPDKVSLPETIKKNSTVTIAHEWQNIGWGYCPNNILQWHQKYKVAFALLNKRDSSVVKIYVDKNSDPSKWIKGSPVNYIFKPVIKNIPSGEYIWAVGIVDTNKNNAIGISLGAKGNITKSGWLTLFNTTVL